MRTFIKENKDTDYNMFLTTQEWKNKDITRYTNIRFIKSRNNIRYKQPVHEYLDSDNNKVCFLPDEIYIFQDRILDNNKSFERYSRDYQILLNEYIKDPSNSRVLFYLAQTCECLGKLDDAIFYSKLRIDCTKTYDEEVFISYNRIAKCSYQLTNNCDDVILYSLKALEIFYRIEPLIQIAEIYIIKKNWKLSYMFLKEASTLEYPKNVILYISKESYDYQVWHLLGLVCYHLGKFNEGREACIKAINYGKDIEINKTNLKEYDKNK